MRFSRKLKENRLNKMNKKKIKTKKKVISKRTTRHRKKKFGFGSMKESVIKPETGRRYLSDMKKQKKRNYGENKSEELDFMIKSIEINNPGIDEEILQAFRTVDRKMFVSHDAYMDAPVHIKHGQTISQPTTIARMLRATKLEPGLEVLEIGANTGYHASLVAWIISPGRVTTIEIFRDLALNAVKNVKRLLKELEERKKKSSKKLNIDIFRGDALNEKSQVWERSYDRIYYTAGVAPQHLGIVKKLALKALNENGLLLFPTRESFDYGGIELWQKKYGKLFMLRRDEGYAFVPVVRQKDLEDVYKKEGIRSSRK
jgi:protein-L-isoaspartate(D-aspartate) O-methyltransferase